MSLKSVPLDRLEHNPAINSRSVQVPVDDLVASIAAHGVILPLAVRQVNGHYEVIDGNRRLDALRELHHPDARAGVQVPVSIRKDNELEADARRHAERGI